MLKDLTKQINKNDIDLKEIRFNTMNIKSRLDKLKEEIERIENNINIHVNTIFNSQDIHNTKQGVF